MGALAGDDSADIADSGCAGSGAGRDVMERQRTGGAKPHQAEEQFLTLFPEQKRIVNLRSQVTMALKNIAHRPTIPGCSPSCQR
ncbi:hypothetical protein O5558_03550 [Escherichia coli]|nr:hypothetical protein [Escherichia coli]